jgi:acetylornithine deacetylase/succinyl-diaminopimelate desuccinylase-like protein
MGFALPDDGMHGPNEKFSLTHFYRGIATSIYFLDEMGKLPNRNHPSTIRNHKVP